MTINLEVEPLVREALAAAVARDAGRSGRALEAMAAKGDTTVHDSIALGIAVNALALHSLHHGRPDDLQIDDLAASFSTMESWAEITPGTAQTFLLALADQRPLGKGISEIELPRLVFTMGGWLLSAFTEGKRDWTEVLDEILDEIESQQRNTSK